MEDFLANVSGWLAAFIAFASGILTWITTKFNKWKSLESVPLKMIIAALVFVAFALVLSAITAIFT